MKISLRVQSTLVNSDSDSGSLGNLYYRVQESSTSDTIIPDTRNIPDRSPIVSLSLPFIQTSLFQTFRLSERVAVTSLTPIIPFTALEKIGLLSGYNPSSAIAAGIRYFENLFLVIRFCSLVSPRCIFLFSRLPSASLKSKKTSGKKQRTIVR